MSYSTSRNSYRVGPYRSFIEFKWALAFDWLRIYYEYEPRCYKLPDGRKYLPDFFNGIDFEETKPESPRKTTNSSVGKIIHTIKEGEVIEHIRSTMNRPYNQTPTWHDWTDSHV